MWRTNRKTDKPYKFPVMNIYHLDRFSDEQIRVAKEQAAKAALVAGDLHARYYGRYGQENWERSDYEASEQAYGDTLYRFLPDAQYAGRTNRWATGPGSTGAELMRAMKKLHLYHGYVTPEETREEFLHRIQLRHVPRE